jgi:PAS domain S-box-containing protein
MKPTYEDLQQKISDLEQILANCMKEQAGVGSLQEQNRLSEAEWKGQESLYKTLIDNLPLAIAIFDKNGKILYANENTENFLRQEKGSLTGKTAHQVYPKEIADDMVYLIRQVIKTRQPLNVDRNLTMFGLSMHLRVTRQPLFNGSGEVTRVLTIGEDITLQQRQLHLLDIQHEIDSLSNLSANLQSSLKLAFQSLMRVDWVDGGGIYLFDDDKKYLRLVFSAGLSKEYTRQVSVYSNKDLPAKIVRMGKAIYANITEFLEPIRDVLKKEKLTFTVAIPLIYEKKVIGSLNLGSRSVDQIAPSDRLIIESIANRLANLISLVKTREKLYSSNRMLNKSLHEIEEKQQMLIQKSRLESLGELSAGLAHEINQPLSVISLVMENIIYKFEKKAVSEDYMVSKFNTITQNINKIRELIDHVRLFSRDQGSIMFERVDVNQVILRALSMVESQMKDNQITLFTELNEDLGNTVGNPSRFEQVMLNLLSNARDALVEKEKKSKTGIRSKEIRISTSMEKDQIFVRVWDSGAGISSLNIDKIFNPFFTTKTEGRGTGLGLPIVYGIITEMKGKITAQSIEGEFTEIIVTLPRYKKNVEKK